MPRSLFGTRQEILRMRPIVIRALRGLDPIAVENTARPGTPDVNYVHGWIELKYVKEWPRRAETSLRVEHYTPQQRAWALRRIAHGGRVHLLLRVGDREWLLLNSVWAARHLGKVPRAMLAQAAEAHWEHGLRPTQLRELLKNGATGGRS